MTHYIETQVKNGVSIRIEVEGVSKAGAGFTGQAAPADLSTDFLRDAYQQTLDTIRGCANGLIDTLQNMAALPSSASIDFSIKIHPEAGAMIAKSRDEGQFRVALSWKQPDSEKDEEKK
jgi:hypothetical protein